MKQSSQRLEITSQGQFLLLIAFIGILLGMNFGLAFLWLPSFALIFYFLPLIRYYYTESNFTTFRVFSASTVTLGGFLHCQLQVKNLQDHSLTLTFENRHSDDIILVEGWTHQTVYLKPGESRKFSSIFTFAKRGDYQFFPLIFYRGDPLGLYRQSYEKEDTFDIRVIPARPYIRLDKQQKKNVRDILTGHHAYRRKGKGDEFFSLREYIRGDEPRKIYWKASARQGKLISKEYTDELVFRIIVAVDISWTMRSRKLEYALTTLLELAEMAAITNDAFGFLLFDEKGPQKFLKPLKSPRLYEKTAKLTFNQAASPNRARFESILPFIFALKGIRGLLIILSDTEGILDEKIKAITMLAKFGHKIIFVDLRGDQFGIVHAKHSIEDLNTLQKLQYTETVKLRINRKYSKREQKIREILKQVQGTYLRVDSVDQNLLIMLRQEFGQEETPFSQRMVNL
ncbi:MAG: DUF58 domain-containing protein [Candidatus Thorarchaeota archaeon]